MKSKDGLMRRTARWCLLLTILAGLRGVAFGANPCCAIQSIDQATGVATAVNSTSGRTFQFKVGDARLLASLKVGQMVYANFGTGKVSVSGIQPCCGIVGSGQGGPVPIAPCCGIESIDSRTGVVTAVSGASAKTFQFKVGDRDLLASLKVGQMVYANFGTGKVSVNGGAPCCGIVEPAAAGGVNPGTPCCGIRSIDPRTGVVTATEKASGNTFRFAVADAALLGSLKVGQAVWANFGAKKVSVDGITPCCGIQP